MTDVLDGKPCVVGLGLDGSVASRTERQRLEREVRYLLQRNALMTLAKTDTAEGDDLASEFRRITEAAAKTLSVNRVSIWRYGTERTSIWCADLYERDTDRHSSGAERSAASYPAYFRALAEGSVIAVDDARVDSRTSEFAGDYLVPLGITSMMDVPIQWGSGLDGVLCHEHVGSPRHWEADESSFAVAAANAVSRGLEASERRRSEAALSDSASRYRALFEDSADAIMLLDMHGFQDCNAATLRLFGVSSRSEFTALHPADVSPPRQADGALSAEAAERNIASALRSGTSRFEWLHQRKDGEVFPAEICFTALTLKGRPVLMATVRDLTDRMRTESELRLQSAALNAAANAIVITDRNGTIAWVNSAFSALTGYGADEAIGKNPRDLVKSGTHDPALYKNLWRTILDGHVWHGEMTNRRKDGTLYPEDMVITPVKSDRGEITHFIAIKSDLTEQRRWESQFLQAQRMEAVGTLAGGIAHDFNNILGVMLGCTEMAAMDAGGNEAVLKNLAQVTAAGQRATKLVQHILAFSGQPDAALQPIHLDPVVTEALALLRASFPASVELRSAFAASTPAVLANPTQVHQIVMNLGINAWHAMKDRPGVIDVTLDVVEADGRQVGPRADRCVRLTVRDTGHGMSPATQSRIFEPFFTTKALGEGTGLGLATVHGIMKSCHGEIVVSSQIGEGTTFQLYFPSADLEAPDAGVSEDSEASVPQGRGQHILFVDDEPSLVVWGTAALERLGYRVTGQTRAVDALAAVAEDGRRFDLLVTDLTMPAMTGFELAERVRTVRPDLPVIFTTGYSAVMNEESVQRYGVNAFISKPVAFKALARAVHRVLEGQE